MRWPARCAGGGVSARAWGPLHQCGRGLAEADLLVEQVRHHFGDGHFHVVAAGQGEDRLRALDAFGGLPGGSRCLFDAQALAEVGAEGAVAGERGGAGGHQVAQTGQAGQGCRVGAHGCGEAGGFCQSAGDEHGLRVVAHAHARGDADGEGDDVLHGAAELAAGHVGVGVGPEVGVWQAC